MIQMHCTILSQQLPRKTELYDSDELSNTVTTPTEKNRIWMIQMHSRIMLHHLLREKELDDPNASSDMVGHSRKTF